MGSKFGPAAEVLLGLLCHVPWCYASLLLFEAHPALAVYLLALSSLLAARSLLVPIASLLGKTESAKDV